jgi:hypothetical protein
MKSTHRRREWRVPCRSQTFLVRRDLGFLEYTKPLGSNL